MKNAINWFEIPVTNFSRARKFYSTILDAPLLDWQSPSGDNSMQYAAFPFDMQNGGVGGVIVKGKGYEPTDKGSVVILNGGNNLTDALARVEEAGGKIAVPKFPIGQFGFLAYITDTEGNRIALHSKN